MRKASQFLIWYFFLVLIPGKELSPQITLKGQRATHYTVAETINGFKANAKAIFMLVTCINLKKNNKLNKQQ